jgi:sortase A
MLARFLRGLGETLITLGAVILLFCAYELWFTGIETAREQRALQRDIERLWRDGGGSYPAAPDATVPEIPLGDGVAVLRIPRLGRDYHKVVVEGVRAADLTKGPGHYPGTQLPGQAGNFVVSGHRTTYGAPFARLDELRAGDPVVVETATTWFTYRVSGTEVVAPTDIGVVYPVPREKGTKPVKALVTLTTCHPKYSARQRLVVFGELAETTRKAPGVLPPALEG